MKRVLFLGGLRSGGAEHQMVQLARLLKQKGNYVAYMTYDRSDFFQKELEGAGISVVRIPSRGLVKILRITTLRNAIFLHRFLKNDHYDTVISFLGEWNFQNCLSAKIKSTRHRAITGIRNNRDEVFLNPKNRFFSIFERFSYRIVSNSQAAIKRYSGLYPHLSQKCIAIYNIVDLPEISSTYQMRRGDRLQIIIPASYSPVKNPINMLKAVASLDEATRCLLCISWYGSIESGKQCYEEMQSYIDRHGLNECVMLYDATRDIANLINKSDAVGLFSTSEGLPNAVCEGMMLGKPIIMSRVSDYDILAGGGNGVLCDAEDVQSIADALYTIVNCSDETLKRMGEVSKAKALELFHPAKVLRHWEEVI